MILRPIQLGHNPLFWKHCSDKVISSSVSDVLMQMSVNQHIYWMKQINVRPNHIIITSDVSRTTSRLSECTAAAALSGPGPGSG